MIRGMAAATLAVVHVTLVVAEAEGIQAAVAVVEVEATIESRGAVMNRGGKEEIWRHDEGERETETHYYVYM
ncbi:hypothetical protein BCR44DRAFT_34468 [Catenaria anguillulae PL171]|uniref:Secreted protein n=1 Tax=Catenaria anguillulae PL171 TaxID=765915 RepID=A0A1Y2I2S7_9FUNG|nr:hypothetical protein BCR44DRAFT_34468 [Catenaria anguillulae PL171]